MLYNKVMYAAKVIEDSVGPNGVRITTMEVTMPKWVLAEFNTHRLFSRNSSSSRACPTRTFLRQVWDNPVVPVHWGALQPGMVAANKLTGIRRWLAKNVWLLCRYPSMLFAAICLAIGLHKQIANRLLEPWMWVTTVVTATEWQGFFNLRLAPDAQPEIRMVAIAMANAMEKSRPQTLAEHMCHLPYITQDERFNFSMSNLVIKSIARCARVSYMRHDCVRPLVDDEKLYNKLLSERHMSPFEHVAMASTGTKWSGNFRGWIQFRSLVDTGFVRVYN